MSRALESPGRVGPVLEANEIGRAVAAAILTNNREAAVDDRGAFLRVTAPRNCSVTRQAIEARIGRKFMLPGDLEQVMPAFHGLIRIGDDEVEWRLGVE